MIATQRRPIHGRGGMAAVEGLDIAHLVARLACDRMAVLLRSGSVWMRDNGSPITLPASVEDTLALLGSADYVADRSLATAVHLALHLSRPLFLEGEAGVGKTEIAKVLATALKRRLIRLQ